MTRSEIIALIVAKAQEHGVVPWELLGGAIAESNLNPLAFRDGVWPDVSPGLFQQTVMYADEGDHTDSPENIALIKQLYFDPVHACDVAAVKFRYWRYDPEVSALQAWCAYNWPGSYRHHWDNPNIENYRAGLAEAQRILGDEIAMPAPPARLNFDPNTPTYLQKRSFTCSIGSVIWCLRSLGIEVDPADAYDAMVGPYVDARGDDGVGLLDGSGAGIVAVLRDHWGVGAVNNASATFDDVAAVAGKQPVAIGLHNWGGSGRGHWSAVRGFDGSQLVLANPGGTGPIYGQQTLTREQFDARGPAALVTVPIGAESPQPAPEPSRASVLLDEITERLAELRRLVA